mgnify:FL=1
MNRGKPRQHLVLFDIDGTLMVTGGAGSRCILRACQKVFGGHFEWGPITVGLPDPQIFVQLARHNHIEQPDQHHAIYREAYLALLEQELQRIGPDIRVMPGIRPLLDCLRSMPRVMMGLVSGNYRKAAELKLRAAGFDLDWFEAQAFAEDGQDRAELVRVAIDRCVGRTGRPLPPGHVIVVGDTPRDIDCARTNGCRSLAVATGRYSLETLVDAGADRVVQDLAWPQPLLEMLKSSDQVTDEC